METLTQYRQRTGFMWDSLPHSGGMVTSPGLRQKADEDGCLLPFYGDTVIFTLPAEMSLWLSQVQQQLYDATADLSAAQAANEQQTEALNEANNRVAQLEQQVSDLSRQRDEAIAAVADAKQQMGTVTELENKLRQKEEQINGMQQAIARYEKVLGTAEEAEQRVDGIVRPLINQANKQADDTLDKVQAALAALLTQLGEVQGNVEQRRLILQRCKEDSDSRLTAAFGDLMEDGNRPHSSNHFFR